MSRQKRGRCDRAGSDESRKTGHERHLVVDRTGTPLAVCLSGANRHDSMVFEELLDAIPPIRRPHGRPRQRPSKLHADKAYDYRRCRQALTRRHIKIRIARKGIESQRQTGSAPLGGGADAGVVEPVSATHDPL